MTSKPKPGQEGRWLTLPIESLTGESMNGTGSTAKTRRIDEQGHHRD